MLRPQQQDEAERAHIEGMADMRLHFNFCLCSCLANFAVSHICVGLSILLKVEVCDAPRLLQKKAVI